MPATVAVTFAISADQRAVVADALGPDAVPVFLTDLGGNARAEALRDAAALLARNTGKDLQPGETELIHNAKLVQFMTAGIDFVPLSALPESVPIAGNGGAYAEPMAEHGVAMILAGAKKLLVHHNALSRGEFNQMAPNRTLNGAVCGILGFGGIGVACAKLLRAFGMKIHAINRRGWSDQPTDWMGTMADVDTLLAASDVLILSLPLTPGTKGMIGPRELGLMKPDAILVNLARGDVVQEAALYAHLQANPAFVACIDAWWVEPIRDGVFRMDYPFTSLPNVIGSPHNSSSVPGMTETALRRAVANIRRVLAGETAYYLLAPEERMA